MSESTRVSKAGMDLKQAAPPAHAPERGGAADGLAALGNQTIQRLYRGGGGVAVGGPDDPLEAEADRVADALVTGRAPCACGATCKCSGRSPPSVQRKADGPATKAAVELGAGQPLEAGVRARFEAGLGQDLGAVRVHADAGADRSARGLNAVAFTTGENIAFRAGRYAPDSGDGERLLAHELAHVVQQRGGGAAPLIQRQEAEAEPEPEPDEEEVVQPAGESVSHDGWQLYDDLDYLASILRKIIIKEKREAAAGEFVRGFNYLEEHPGGSPDERTDVAFGDQVKATLESALIMVEGEASTIKEELTTQAQRTLSAMLQDSEDRVQAEREKYGITEEQVLDDEVNLKGGGASGAPGQYTYRTKYTMADDLRTQALAGAARDLSAKRKEIADLYVKRAAVDPGTGGAEGANADSSGTETVALREAQVLRYDQEIYKADEELKLLRLTYETRYPILAAFGTDDAAVLDDDDAGLNQVGRGPGPEATPILMRVIKERLENIQKVREGFADRGDVWKLPAVIAASLAVSGHKPGTFEAALAAGYMSDADDDFTDTVLAVLSIGLSLALAIPTGGGSLVVTAASGAIVALDIVQIYRDVEKYELGVAAANTDFDKARAVSQEEPSLVWLGLSILLTVAGDVGEAASIFKGMAPIVNKALGGTIDDLARNGPDIIAGLRTAGHSEQLAENVYQRMRTMVERGRGSAILEEGRAIEKAAAQAVEGTKHLPNDMLKAVDIEAELEFLKRSGGLEGAVGTRVGKLGEHHWMENGPGRWCRYSAEPLCILLGAGGAETLEVTGRLGKETVGTAEHKAARWQEYEASGGVDDYDSWSQRYDDTLAFGAGGTPPAGPIEESLLWELEVTSPSVGTHLPEKRYLGSSLPPAIEVPDAGAGSWYAMGPLDDKGRATWVDAVLNKTDLSDAPRGKLDDPAGWESGLNYNRTHLGAHQLGFPPDPRNVTTAAREVNTFGNLPPAGVTDLRPPNMRAVEIQVAEALNAGQTVRYRVTPIYHGDAPMPVAYSMQVEGTGGPMKPLSIDTVIRGWTHHTK